MMLAFTVHGVAQPKGSARAFVAGGRAVVTSANRNVKAWQQLVALGASDAIRVGRRGLTDGPVRVIVTFHLPRPKKYARRGGAIAHTTKPDVDKLARCVLDALTAIVFRDDAQVVELVARKEYAAVDAPASCDVCVAPVPKLEVPL